MDEHDNRLEEYYVSILNIIVENWDYFKSRPKRLAWAMMHYQIAYLAGCYLGNTEDFVGFQPGNPKYPILYRESFFDNQEEFDLLYDAWVATISNDPEFLDAQIDLEYKENKTVDEWVELFTDPQYRYNSLFPTKDSSIDYLLGTIGSGLFWNNDGFITSLKGPFQGYTKMGDYIRKDLHDKITAISYNKELAPFSKKIWEEHEQWAANNKARKKFYRIRRFFYYKLWVDHRQAIESFLEDNYDDLYFICNYNCLVEQAFEWSEKEWEEAIKKSVYNIYGKTININEIRSDFIHNYMDLECKLSSIKDPAELKSLSSVLKIRVFPPHEDKGDIKYGWEVIKSITEKKKATRKAVSEMLKKRNNYDQYSKFYPISEYSNIYTMPKNAHPSYIEAAKIHLDKIIKDPLTTKASLSFAKEICDKWGWEYNV
jgi:hypothetical protein